MPDQMRGVQVIKALNGLVQADKSSEKAKEIANLMYETALLTSGFDVEAPKEYAAKVYGMMGLALSQDVAQGESKSSGTSGGGALEADQVIEE
jgi:Hsp90 protein